jgi:hypothetical protein
MRNYLRSAGSRTNGLCRSVAREGSARLWILGLAANFPTRWAHDVVVLLPHPCTARSMLSPSLSGRVRQVAGDWVATVSSGDALPWLSVTGQPRGVAP